MPETEVHRNRYEPTRRGGCRWTKEEDSLIDDLTGSVTTQALARRLGRTPKAVRSRMQYLGVSHYDHDGRYTAAEVSRSTGIPLPTICEWLEMGKISGAQKIGRVWRVEWDGESFFGPEWDGKKLDISPSCRETCLECGAALPSHASTWCSKPCRGKTMHRYLLDKIRNGKDASV